MIVYKVTFDTERLVAAGDTADVFTNCDSRGIASGDLKTTPVNSQPLRMFSGEDTGPSWLVTPHLTGVWLGRKAVPNLTFSLPPAHFGRMTVAAKAKDALGNYQAGESVDSDVIINSTPEPPTAFKRGSFASGQLAFSFSPSPQLRGV